ncbi:MAG: hypothetical protein ACK2U1_14460 [Anaerolineales bacterium]|jgi:hypothetical protein
MQVDKHSLHKAKILVERLARLSADSIWARRASGLRASLDKAVGQIEKGIMVDSDHFNHLVALGYEMIEKAAEEIPVPEDILFKHKNIS